MAPTQSKLIDPSFPTELLLEVLQHVPFDPKSIQKLALVHPRFNDVLKNHQKSIVKDITRRQLPHVRTDFPCKESIRSYSWLANCVRQYDVVDDVMSVIVSPFNCFAVQRHNMAVVNTGLLLLYRLQSFDEHDAKVAFIKSSPRDPLTAMFLAAHFSTLAARFLGEGLINSRKYGRFPSTDHQLLRRQIEFCFTEGVLLLGPDFINNVLNHVDENETTLHNLYLEHSVITVDWDVNAEGAAVPPIIQGPKRKEYTKPDVLYIALMDRLAEFAGCPFEDVVQTLLNESEAPNHSLAYLSLANKARLVFGLDLDKTATATWCMEQSFL